MEVHQFSHEIKLGKTQPSLSIVTMKNWLEATVETRNAKESRRRDDKSLSFLGFPEFGSLEAGITINV